MKSKTGKKRTSVFMILPLYLFTIVFVACPLIYVLILSFTPQEGGFAFTLENYRRILEPVYLDTFIQSFQLAVTSTLIICVLGYPFGYFMARLPKEKKEKAMLFLMLAFLGEFPDPSLRVDYHSSEKGNTELYPGKTGNHR